MRDLHSRGQTFAAARHDAEPFPLAVFEPHAGEKLHTEADAEEGRAGSHALAHEVPQARLTQVARGVAKRAHTGQYDAVRRCHHGGVVGHGHARDAGVLESLLDAAQVPHAVVEDGDARCHPGHSAPLVEGTPLTRGSSTTASASARASALNAASTT